MAQTFFVDDEVADGYFLDGIITVVDAKHILQHLEEEKPADVENESVEQIAFADRILLNKVDLLQSQEEKDTLLKKIRDINAMAPIIESVHSMVDLGQILNTKSFDLQKILTMEPEFLKDSDHTHDNSVSSMAIVEEGTIDHQKFMNWLRGVLSEKGADIFRSKGIVNSKDHDSALVFQGVHMLLDMKRLDASKPSINRLVFIGRNLDREELTKGFKQCLLY